MSYIEFLDLKVINNDKQQLQMQLATLENLCHKNILFIYHFYLLK